MAAPTLADAAALLGRGLAAQAVTAVQTMLQAAPGDPLAWQLLGLAHLTAGDVRPSIAALERSLALRPQDARTLSLLGVAQAQLGDHAAALAQFDQATEIEPLQPQLWYDRAKVQHTAGRALAALASLDRALALQPGFGPAWLNRGNVLRELDRLPEALASLEQAARLAPHDALAWHALAEALCDARRHDEASACCARAVALAPQHDGVWTTYGNAEFERGQAESSLHCYVQACEINPGNVRAWVGRARCLVELRRPEEAVHSLRHAVSVEDGGAEHVLELTRLTQALARWDELPPLWTRCLQGLEQPGTADGVFTLLSNPEATAQDILLGGRSRARKERNRVAGPVIAVQGTRRPRIRIGYLSADLRAHPITYLMAGVFEAHDRSRFEVVALDIGTRQGVPDSPWQQRLRAGFDDWLALGSLPAAEAALHIRNHGIDILVDLMGATKAAQPGVLLRRPAPVQVTYLGFPGTSGMDEIDYILADRWVAPMGQDAEFSEHVVRLPDSFQANDRQRHIADDTPPRRSLGLPESGFVFCCFNNTYKLLPRSFDIWMRLLARVPGSVLWLLGESTTAMDQLREQARRRGIDPTRLVFATRCAYPDYLARYRRADLFLDTLPFNAGTTASDALWAGLPVLSQVGNHFAGRMAASLLDAAGLPELITRSDAEYEALALRLAAQQDLLASLRDRLAAQRLTCPLFDTARFTRHLEQAFTTMWERHLAGLSPQGFDVPRLEG